MIQVQTWTDGSSDVNTREGGWGAVITLPSANVTVAKIVGGHQCDTTNNAMEAHAVLGVLYQLNKQCDVEVITDSQYVVYGIARVNNPRKALLESNRVVWEILYEYVQDYKHVIHTTKIKGHVGEPLNEIADRVAVYARKHMTIIEQTFEDLDQKAIRAFMEDMRQCHL